MKHLFDKHKGDKQTLTNGRWGSMYVILNCVVAFPVVELKYIFLVENVSHWSIYLSKWVWERERERERESERESVCVSVLWRHLTNEFFISLEERFYISSGLSADVLFYINVFTDKFSYLSWTIELPIKRKLHICFETYHPFTFLFYNYQFYIYIFCDSICGGKFFSSAKILTFRVEVLFYKY